MATYQCAASQITEPTQVKHILTDNRTQSKHSLALALSLDCVECVQALLAPSSPVNASSLYRFGHLMTF